MRITFCQRIVLKFFKKNEKKLTQKKKNKFKKILNNFYKYLNRIFYL